MITTKYKLRTMQSTLGIFMAGTSLAVVMLQLQDFLLRRYLCGTN